ncbi:MAG: 16S rRNA (cytosine(1402)-N(4))-methyltransferase RsmH [Cytophagales bacterium]
MNQSYTYHKPVMLEEAIRELNIKPNGIYIDLTFGGGGHTKEILKRLKKGSVIAFDLDPDAKSEALKIQDNRFSFVQGNFRFFAQFLRANHIKKVDGILADLGLSSHQLDSQQRGFAARLDGPLDMRMHQEEGLTAATLLNTYTFPQLVQIFKTYGNINHAKRLATHIITRRDKNIFQSVVDLRKAISPCIPKRREYKFFAKTFQALRIAVNDEQHALHEALEQIPYFLAPKGRFVALAYHSGEDRPIKNFIKTGNVKGNLLKDFYGNIIRPLMPIHRKALVPTQKEIMQNNRARSAQMRVATKS